MEVKNTLTPRAREVVVVLLIIVFIIAAFTISPMSRSQAKSIVTNSEFVVFDENNTIYIEESKFKGDLKEALEVYETSMGYDVRVVVDEPLDI